MTKKECNASLQSILSMRNKSQSRARIPAYTLTLPKCYISAILRNIS